MCLKWRSARECVSLRRNEMACGSAAIGHDSLPLGACHVGSVALVTEQTGATHCSAGLVQWGRRGRISRLRSNSAAGPTRQEVGAAAALARGSWRFSVSPAGSSFYFMRWRFPSFIESDRIRETRILLCARDLRRFSSPEAPTKVHPMSAGPQRRDGRRQRPSRGSDGPLARFFLFLPFFGCDFANIGYTRR